MSALQVVGLVLALAFMCTCLALIEVDRAKQVARQRKALADYVAAVRDYEATRRR